MSDQIRHDSDSGELAAKSGKVDEQCNYWETVDDLQRKLDAEGKRADNLAIELEDARAEYDRLKAEHDKLTDLYGRIASLLADAQGKISAALSYTED